MNIIQLRYMTIAIKMLIDPWRPALRPDRSRACGARWTNGEVSDFWSK